MSPFGGLFFFLFSRKTLHMSVFDSKGGSRLVAKSGTSRRAMATGFNSKKKLLVFQTKEKDERKRMKTKQKSNK